MQGGVPQHHQQQQQQLAALQASASGSLPNLAATPAMRGRGGGPRVSNAIARALRQRQTAGVPSVPPPPPTPSPLHACRLHSHRGFIQIVLKSPAGHRFTLRAVNDVRTDHEHGCCTACR